MAFIAYHFHWPKEQLMDLPHLERRQWVNEISQINKEINESVQDLQMQTY